MKKLMAGLLIGLGSLSIESSSAMNENAQIKANKVNQTEIVWNEGGFLNTWNELDNRKQVLIEDIIFPTPPSVKLARESSLIFTIIWDENAKFFADIYEKINRIIASETVMDEGGMWSQRFMSCVDKEVSNAISSTEYSLAFEDNNKGFGKMMLRVGCNKTTMTVTSENASYDSFSSHHFFGTWSF